MSMGTLLIGVLLGLLPANPGSSSVEDEAPYVVQMQMELPAQELDFADASGLTLRVDSNESVVLVLRVSDPGHGNKPVDVEETQSLLEIRDESGSAPSVRLADMERVAPGVYRTIYTFYDPGRWALVVQPDIGDRASHPAEKPVVFIVEEPAADVAGGPGTIEVVLLGMLVVLVGSLVIGATRHRVPVPKRPIVHDTLWNRP